MEPDPLTPLMSSTRHPISEDATPERRGCASFFGALQTCYDTSKTLLQYSWRALSPKKQLAEEERLEAYREKCRSLQEVFQSLEGSDEKVVKGGFNLSHLSRPRAAGATKVDMHALTSVISVDADFQIAHVEGMTSFYDIVKKTLNHGFIPKDVPKLGGITLGGANEFVKNVIMSRLTP